MSHRRSFIATLGAAALAIPIGLGILGGATAGKETPGVTATEIKIGQTMPYSGPASAYGAIGKAEVAFFKMINDKGGVNGRKINLISYDDSYAPAKAVEQVRKLVEQDNVAFTFNTLGTPSNSAIQKYLNTKKVPHLFLATGADKWADPKGNPWTIGWQPSYRTEATIYAKYIAKEKPAAKVCIIYQNDDFGKDYIIGLKEGFGADYEKKVVKEVSYEVTDPTVDSQIVTLQGSGCDTLITAATPKFAAQAIRKVSDIGWKPTFFMSNVSISIAAVFKPAGMEKAVGIITGAYLKDINDPAWKDDAGMNEYREFMKKYLPDADITDGNYLYGFGAATTMVHVIKACGDDLSRENVMKQAANIKKLQLGVALPGIEINTGPTDFRVFSQMQLSKFNGTSFDRFGNVISGD